jgi:hypothetical protein
MITTHSKQFKYTIGLSLLTMVLSVASVAQASFDATAWQYYRDIGAPTGSSFVKIVLPDTASRGSTDFADIRVMTSGNTEVPYFLTKNSIVRGGTTVGSIVDQTQNAGATQFIVDTGSVPAVHTGLTIDSPLSNFKRRVSVYSSTTLIPVDSSAWNKVIDTGFIFRFTDPYTGFTSGKDSISFPSNTSRYLKVVIDAGPEGAVSASRVNVYGDKAIDVPSYSKDISVSMFNNPEHKTTEVTIDLGESGHMTDSVTLNILDTNYSRRVIVEVTDTASSTWRKVGQSSISSVSTTLFTGSSNKITYPEQKARYIRLSIVNDDNRPLAIGSTARVEGPIVSAVFETRTGESYRLYYGNPKAYTPTYDIVHISSYIETNKLPLATVGAEIISPLYVAPATPHTPFAEQYPWALNTFLVFIVIIIAGAIGWYLYLYIKKNGSSTGFGSDQDAGATDDSTKEL